MSEIPVIIVGTVFPRDKSVKPYPATIAGWAHIAGLEVGGGPMPPGTGAHPEHPIVLPPDEVPPVDPPLVIWGGPIDPYPDHGLPIPPTPPDKPPATSGPIHEGWNFNTGSNPAYPNSGWFYVYIPGAGTAGPNKK